MIIKLKSAEQHNWGPCYLQSKLQSLQIRKTENAVAA